MFVVVMFKTTLDCFVCKKLIIALCFTLYVLRFTLCLSPFTHHHHFSLSDHYHNLSYFFLLFHITVISLSLSIVTPSPPFYFLFFSVYKIYKLFTFFKTLEYELFITCQNSTKYYLQMLNKKYRIKFY